MTGPSAPVAADARQATNSVAATSSVKAKSAKPDSTAIPDWFAEDARSFDQPRNRYNMAAHLDLHEWLTNNGASRFNGGLSLAANLIGKPGKLDVAGHMVQDLWDTGRAPDIHDYCRGDVLDTYFIFLRSRVCAGELTLDEERQDTQARLLRGGTQDAQGFRKGDRPRLLPAFDRHKDMFMSVSTRTQARS